jgi:hypothetical protein
MSTFARSESISVAAVSSTSLREWQRFLSINATVVIFAIMAFFMAFAVTGCGGGGGGTVAPPVTPTVAAPGAPTNFAVIRTPETTLSATLTWSVPLAGGDPASFEVYRSTAAGTVFQSANHLVSIPAVAGKTTYTFIDDAGLTPRVETYWVVSAKNAGGETPTAEVAYVPIGGGGGGDIGFGNNFSAALIFADDIGITGLPVTGTWTFDAASAVANTTTGLRPLSTEVLPVTVLPYFDPTSAYTLDNVVYYRQQTASTWQGEWVNGSATTTPNQQDVTAMWGDNLISQSLTANSTIRIEMVLTEALSTPMTSYTMKSLYGTKENEVQGTDGTTYDNSTAFVFASNAHLKIEKLDGAGVPIAPALYDQTLWTGDGPGYLAGEVNVAGNFTYGFVWNLKNQDMSSLPGVPKAGKWRLTFSLDSTSPKGTSNHTNIIVAPNSTSSTSTEASIDITVN